MASQSNPAGRLHELIVKAATTRNPQSALTIKEAWRHALEVDPDDDSTLLRRLGLVYALPAQIRAQVSELPGETHELYLRHLPRIESALQADGRTAGQARMPRASEFALLVNPWATRRRTCSLLLVVIWSTRSRRGPWPASLRRRHVADGANRLSHNVGPHTWSLRSPSRAAASPRSC